MSHLTVFLMISASYLIGDFLGADSITNPFLVSGGTLLSHWIWTR